MFFDARVPFACQLNSQLKFTKKFIIVTQQFVHLLIMMRAHSESSQMIWFLVLFIRFSVELL